MSILSLTSRTKSIDPHKSQFEEGLRIVEIKDGKEVPADEVVLVGAMMPKDSLDFGGSQRAVKHYYAGSSEPTVQVMGPEEDDITIKGTIDLKKLKGADVFSDKESAAVEYQELIDAMRIRGNLVKITLGQWYRYGFIQASKFKMYSLTKIDYEITFLISGFNQPKNYYLIDDSRTDLIAPNKQLTNKLAELMNARAEAPIEFPQNLLDTVNSLISEVASKISAVTNFIDGVITDAEEVRNSANRAIGLIKNARAFISRSQRRIGQVGRDAATLGTTVVSESEKTLATMNNIQHLHKLENLQNDAMTSLRSLQVRYAALISTIPKARHFVTEGDSLQSLSIKYYGNADKWEKIMAHNKLSSTVLKKGTVIEIPR